MSVFNGRASDIEDNRNKVSTINENSTDTQYPSAKAVYDAMQSVTVDYSLVANALKGSVSGKVVAIKDISPLPHTVLVKASGGGVGEELLTKTETLSTKGATVMLNTPAELVRVVVRGGAYCVGGLVPTVSGDDLTASGIREQLALWPTWYYGEAPGVYDLEYTISGDTLSWSGVKYYASDSSENEAVSGSVELSTTGQKITGFCQVYDLSEDNPYAESPEYDQLDMTVAVYESTPSVEVKVYGKNLLPDLKAFLNGGNIYFGVTAYTQGVPLKKGTYTFSFVSDAIATGIYILTADGKTEITKDFNKKNRITFTLPEDMGVRIRAYSPQFTSKDDVVSAQVELGSSVTEHEPYIEPTNHTVMADGTAFESVYPSMTFVPETDGVELSVEYNRDINKAFAQLQAALISMGGNI